LEKLENLNTITSGEDKLLITIHLLKGYRSVKLMTEFSEKTEREMANITHTTQL